MKLSTRYTGSPRAEWKKIVRRRQVQPGVIRPRERAKLDSSAREGQSTSHYPPSGAMATGGRHPKAMTFATAVETSAMAEPAERSHE